MHLIAFLLSFWGLNPSSSCLCVHENMVSKLPSCYLSMDASTNSSLAPRSGCSGTE